MLWRGRGRRSRSAHLYRTTEVSREKFDQTTNPKKTIGPVPGKTIHFSFHIFVKNFGEHFIFSTKNPEYSSPLSHFYLKRKSFD